MNPKTAARAETPAPAKHRAKTPAPTAADFALVVVNFGSHELIDRNIAPTLAREARAHVVVVDNLSDTAERDAVARLCRERGWELVAQGDNPGFAAGVNTGVEAARRRGLRVVVTLNPDASADAPTLASLARGVREHPGSLASPLVRRPDGTFEYRGSTVSLRTGRIRGGWIEGDADPEWKNWLGGACLAFDLATFDDLGGMDPTYFLYWEDVDFSRRAAAAGHPLVLRRDLTITHDEGGTHNPRGSRAKSPTYYFHNARNRLLFGRRLGTSTWGEWIMTTPVETWRIWTRGGRRQLFTHPAGALAAVAGAARGIRTPATLARPSSATGAPPVRSGPLFGRTVLVAHPGTELYGSDRVLLESVQALVEAGARVVTVLPDNGPLAEELRRRGSCVQVCPMPVLRKAALSPSGMLGLAEGALTGLGRARRVLRAADPDIVLVNTLTIPLWILLGRLAGIPTLCHVHEAERSVAPLVRRGLYAPLLLATGILTNSRFSLKVISRTWPRLAPRTAVVHNGVEGPPRVTPPRADLDDAPRILFLGRLSPRKGPQVALEALDLLHRRGLRARLTLLGSTFPGYEWFEAELRERVRALHLQDSVEFLGFDADIWPHVAACDIVAVPSIVDESFGNTAVEAMLAERPLVVSRTSGLKQASVAYSSVRRVKPGSARSFARAVTSLVDHWQQALDGVEDDRRLALDRHAPHRYRARFVEEVLDLLAPTGLTPTTLEVRA